MRRPGGYAVITAAGPTPVVLDRGLSRADMRNEGIMEIDSFTCHHCNRIVHVLPRCDPANLGGHCKRCDKLICPSCYGKGDCTPWEKAMEKAEASYHARRSYGI
jgi:hypothetical protein